MQAILVGLNNSLVSLNFRRRDTAGMGIQWPIGPGGGGNSHKIGAGMLIRYFELNTKRGPTWAWPKLFLTPKRVNKMN